MSAISKFGVGELVWFESIFFGRTEARITHVYWDDGEWCYHIMSTEDEENEWFALKEHRISKHNQKIGDVKYTCMGMKGLL